MPHTHSDGIECDATCQFLDENSSRVGRLIAENARFKEALEDIAYHQFLKSDEEGNTYTDNRSIIQIALDALGE